MTKETLTFKIYGNNHKCATIQLLHITIAYKIYTYVLCILLITRYQSSLHAVCRKIAGSAIHFTAIQQKINEIHVNDAIPCQGRPIKGDHIL